MDKSDGNCISPEEVRSFYNLLPRIYEESGLWHNKTHSWVMAFIAANSTRTEFNSASRVLNAGSGGLPCPFPEDNVYHVDITPKNLPQTGRTFVGDVQNLPFEDASFDISLCVGSVLNYCDAPLAIASLARVTKDGGYLFLEFETSAAWDYLFSANFMQNAALVTTFYSQRNVRLWIYAEHFITVVLRTHGFAVHQVSRNHILSPLIYRLTRSESFAARFSRFDSLLRRIPVLRKFCSNVIFLCQKKNEV